MIGLFNVSKTFGDIKDRLVRLKSPLTVLAVGISANSITCWGLILHYKLRTLDKPVGFLILKPSGVQFAEVSFQDYT